MGFSTIICAMLLTQPGWTPASVMAVPAAAHDGFPAFTDKEPGIKYLLNNQSGDWKQDKAYNIMTTALRNNEKIDLIYGQNDPMVYGAYLATKDAGRKDIKFILGTDGLADEGVTWCIREN